MAARGIDPNNFRYYPPNFSEDIQQSKPFIFLGSFAQRPTRNDLQTESLRELIIKTNMTSKGVIYKLGDVQIHEKEPSKQYDWIVIKVTIATLYNGLRSGLKITCFLLFSLSAIISIASVWARVIVDHKDENPTLVLLGFAMLFGIDYHLSKWLNDSFDRQFLPLIAPAQKPYLDRFVAFQKLDQIRIEGFDTGQLANETTEAGWVNPITKSIIPRDQISSAQILRIRQHALPIIDALKVMLKLPCSQREIHHPIFQDEHLTLVEKTQFLREVSNFFGIRDPNDLNACWHQTVSLGEIEPFFDRIPHLDYLPNGMQLDAIMNIGIQLLANKQKKAFLKLLPQSIAQEYFDAEFHSEQIVIPDPAGQNLLLRLHPVELALVCMILISEAFRLQQN